MREQIKTSSKKVRGMARASLDLIETMHKAAEAAHPITGRGIGYKLFTASLIPSMETGQMQRVYRLLKEAREREMIPWEWIVDETRELERRPSWDDPRCLRPRRKSVLPPRLLEPSAGARPGVEREGNRARRARSRARPVRRRVQRHAWIQQRHQSLRNRAR